MKTKENNYRKDWKIGKKAKKLYLHILEGLCTKEIILGVIKVICSRGKSLKLLSLKNLMLGGKTFPDSKEPKVHSKKQSFFQLNSRKFLSEVENLGKEFCFMDLQEQEKLI